MSALGAKYCHFNAVSPADFIEVLSEFTPAVAHRNQYLAGTPPACAVDVPGFRIVAFANYIGEHAALLRTQSLISLGSIALLQRAGWGAGPKSSPFYRLRGCVKCFEAGYHSVVHQASSMTRCFIHIEEKLVDLPDAGTSKPKASSVDLRHVDSLRELWFGRKAKYPIIEIRAALSAQELQTAERSAQRIRTLSNKADGEQTAATVVSRLVLKDEDQHAEAVAALPESIKKGTGRWGQRLLEGSRWVSGRTLRLALPDASSQGAVIEILAPWLGYFCASRLVQAIDRIDDAAPEWLELVHSEHVRMMGWHYFCHSETKRVLDNPDYVLAVEAISGYTSVDDEDLIPFRFEDKLFKRRALPCIRLLMVRWWDEMLRPNGDAFQSVVGGLRQGRFCPASSKPPATVLKPLIELGLCEECCGEFDIPLLPGKGRDMSMAWPNLLGLEPRPYVAEPSEVRMFVPAGELLAVVDLILLFSVRTIAWVLYEFEAQLELEVAEEAEAEGSDSIWQFMDRLKETAPQRILGGSRSKVTASVLCHYPAGLPTWNPTGRRNSAEHKRVKALALKKLERALRELVSYRRSLVDRLATSRGGDKPPAV